MRKRQYVLWGISLLLLALANIANAIVMPSIDDAPAYEVHGQNFAAVGYILGIDADGNAFLSSGTVLSPKWVICDAKSLVALAPESPYGYIEMNETTIFGTGADPSSDPGEQFICSRIYIYEDFPLIESYELHDIALLYFGDDPISGVDFAEIYEGDFAVGTAMDWVGYGVPGQMTGDGYTPEWPVWESGTIKRAFTSPITSLGAYFPLDDFVIASHFVVSNYAPLLSSLPGMVGFGDDGGGVFINGKLAGVSATWCPYGLYPSSVATMLGPDVRMWIQEVMHKVDGSTNMIDFAAFAKSYLSTAEDPEFDRYFDANSDYTIDLEDFATFVARWQ